MTLGNKTKYLSIMFIFALIFFMSACGSKSPDIVGAQNIEITVGTELPDLLEGIEVNEGLIENVVVDTSAVNINVAGEYVVTYTLTIDGVDPIVTEITVSVVDEPTSLYPSIDGVQDLTYVIGEAFPDLLDGVTATDDTFGDLTFMIDVDVSKVDLSTLGEYLVDYHVSNEAGYHQVVTTTLTVTVDEAEPILPDEFFIISRFGAYGLTDLEGNEIIPLKYDDISYAGDNMLALLLEDEIYFYNSDTKEYMDYEYNVASYFYDGYAVVYDENEYQSLMSKDGEILLPFVYNRINNNYDGTLYAKMGENWGMIDKTGTELIRIKYEDISSFINDTYIVELDNRFIVLNSNFEQILELSSSSFSDYSTEDSTLFSIEIDNKETLVDEEFDVLFTANESSLMQLNDSVYMGIENYIYTIYNIDTDLEIPGVTSHTVVDDIMFFQTTDGMGAFDIDAGTLLIEAQYQELSHLATERLVFKAMDENGLYGVVNSSNTMLINFIATEITYDENTDMIRYRKADETVGLLHNDGTAKTAKTYYSINDYSDGFALFYDSSASMYGVCP